MATSVEFLEFLRELAEAAPLPRFVLLLDEWARSHPSIDTFFNTLRTVLPKGGDGQPAGQIPFVLAARWISTPSLLAPIAAQHLRKALPARFRARRRGQDRR